MREIKFRGIPCYDEMFPNLFIYGSLSIGCTTASSKIIDYGIHQANCYPVEVIPETIGQFTGIVDINEEPIFEGDIITIGDANIKYVVHFIECQFLAEQNGSKSQIGLHYWRKAIEIVGNIHQNPELLERK